MNFTAISDSHGLHRGLEIPHADVLIHSGDCGAETVDRLEDFLAWIAEQPHAHKILIAGNHDWAFQNESQDAMKLCEDYGVIYLLDSGIKIEDTRFWGSPFTPTFMNWAFMEDRGPDIAKHWALIPEHTDILITHGPPKNILDKTSQGEHAGCEILREYVFRLQPKHHIFGHIHESCGHEIQGQTTFVNASVLDGLYRPWRKQIPVWSLT